MCPQHLLKCLGVFKLKSSDTSYPSNYQKSGLDGVLSFEYPTIIMDFDFLTDLAGKMEWIWNRTKMHKLENYRFDMHIQILVRVDVSEDLLATLRQFNLLFEHTRKKSHHLKSTV